MTLWDDPIHLQWTAAEREQMAREGEAAMLLDPLPRGIHVRPRGPGREVLLIWTYDAKPAAPLWPPPYPPHYAETLMRGAARMIPGLERYAGHADSGIVDGGYYCKTRENRPLLGPLPIDGAYVMGALSGFGFMASQGAADLVGAHMTGSRLPDYAPAFHPARYEDPDYLRELDAYSGWSGQL
jgi:glycine/D-amino acid oxidase-like deaminating enzyme